MLVLTFSLVFQEVVDFRDRTVKGDDGESMIGDVQDQVLAHDGQTNEAKITTRDISRSSADIDAGKSRAVVSKSSSVSRQMNSETLKAQLKE